MPRNTIEAQAQVDRKPFSAAHDCFEALLTRLKGQKCMVMSHSELERVIDVDGREILRSLFQGHLDLRSAGEVDSRVVGVDDNDARERGRKRVRDLGSVFGTVTVARDAYTKPEDRSLFVLDGYLNLPPELYSFGLRRTIAIEAAKVSFDEVVAAVERSTGVTVPKRQAEQLAQRAAVDFDAFYAQRAHDKIVEEDEILVVTTDGKGICMLVEHLRPATRKAAKKRQPKLDKRQSKGEKSKKRRMAQVAAVYTVARFERSVDDIVGDLGSTTTTAPSVTPSVRIVAVFPRQLKTPQFTTKRGRKPRKENERIHGDDEGPHGSATDGAARGDSGGVVEGNGDLTGDALALAAGSCKDPNHAQQARAKGETRHPLDPSEDASPTSRWCREIGRGRACRWTRGRGSGRVPA